MDWNQTRAVYMDKLEKASALTDRTLALCHKAPNDVPAQARGELEKLRPLVNRQEEKLKANCFEVAVLGLEKAGKSTLLNAWLGVEILPAMDERCTYTSCEIWSAPSEDDQGYIIEYYAPEEFETELAEKRRLLKELPQGFSELGGDLRNDIREIEQHYDNIQHFLRQGRYETKFRDVEDVRDDLTEAIAKNKAQARAIKRIVLRTIKLRADRDIIFHDVPGFNSPLKLHKALANDKLRRCDAILYAKEHDKPDLVDSEVEMLKVADREDPYIRVAGKIFIALTRIDKAESRQRLNERIEKAYGKWKNVPEERIVPVSPPACLFRLGTGGPSIMRDGKKIIQDMEAIGFTDGIEELKRVVNHYIDTDRARVLESRCKGLLKDVEKNVSVIMENLMTRYPDNPEDVDEARRDAEFNIFTNWWKDRWTGIEEDFSNYYTTEIMPKEHVDASASQHERLRQFRSAYNELADRLTDTLSYSDEKFEMRYRTLGLTEEGIILPVTAHIKLREELHEKALQELNDISSDLARAIEAVINEIGDWVIHRLWDIEKIRDDLLESPVRSYDRLNHGMSTLFLRFARPAVNLFLLSPRGSRDKYIETYHSDIVTLSEFYQEEEQQEKKDLKIFLETGRRVLKMKEEPSQKAGKMPRRGYWTEEIPDHDDGDYLDEIGLMADKTSPQDIEGIKAEIQEDLQALGDYVKNSIFHASGFMSYFRQELDRVKGRFLNNETKWQQHVAAACRRKHPPLMEEESLSIENYEFIQGIILEMAEVRNKLAELRTAIR